MSSGQSMIVSKGTDGVFTFGGPLTSQFVSVYKRFSNFSTQFIDTEIELSRVDFGKRLVVTIPRKGDLIKTIFLKFTLQPPSQLDTPFQVYTSTKAPGGYQFFEYADLYIGDTRVERLTPDSIRASLYFNSRAQRVTGMQSIVGQMYGPFNISLPQQSGLLNKPCDFLVPLPFYFFRKNSELLPLLALSKQEVSVELKFVNKTDYGVILYSVGVPHTDFNRSPYKDLVNAMKVLSFSMPIEYVYLSESEQEYFKKSQLFYYVNQNQTQFEKLTQQSTKIRLNFINQVKDFSFYITDERCYTSSNIVFKNQQDNFKYLASTDAQASQLPSDRHILNSVELKLNNEVYLSSDVADFNFMTFMQGIVNRCNTIIDGTGPANYVYSYSFALDPSDNAPTGTLDFNAIQNVDLTVNLTFQLIRPRPIVLIARSLNVMKIHEGVASLLFNNNLQL